MRRGELQRETVAGLLPELAARNRLALEFWQQLGGWDWTGIDILLDVHDVADPADLVERLMLIRDGVNRGAQG